MTVENKATRTADIEPAVGLVIVESGLEQTAVKEKSSVLRLADRINQMEDRQRGLTGWDDKGVVSLCPSRGTGGLTGRGRRS